MSSPMISQLVMHRLTWDRDQSVVHHINPGTPAWKQLETHINHLCYSSSTSSLDHLFTCPSTETIQQSTSSTRPPSCRWKVRVSNDGLVTWSRWSPASCTVTTGIGSTPQRKRTKQLTWAHLFHTVLMELIQVQSVDPLLCSKDQALIWSQNSKYITDRRGNHTKYGTDENDDILGELGSTVSLQNKSLHTCSNFLSFKIPRLKWMW